MEFPNLIGIITVNANDPDFDANDFESTDFNCSGNGFRGIIKPLTIGIYFDSTYFDEQYFECEGKNLSGVLIKQ